MPNPAAKEDSPDFKPPRLEGINSKPPILGLEFRVSGFGFRVWGLGFRGLGV